MSEVQALIKNRNAARRYFQSTNNPYFRLLRNMLSQKIYNLLNSIKISEWNKRLSKLNTQDHSFWNHYKIFSRKKSPFPPLDDPNNNAPVQDDACKANLLADTFQEVHLASYNSTSPHEEDTLEVVDKIQNSSPHYIYSNFTVNSLRNIIKTLPNKKSPDLDKISALHLKNLHKNP